LRFSNLSAKWFGKLIKSLKQKWELAPQDAVPVPISVSGSKIGESFPKETGLASCHDVLTTCVLPRVFPLVQICPDGRA
jgi:hypothetical protein